MLIVMRQIWAGLRRQQFVVDSQAGDQPQSTLVGAVNPIDIGLLVYQGCKSRPDNKIRPAAASRMPKFGIDI